MPPAKQTVQRIGNAPRIKCVRWRTRGKDIQQAGLGKPNAKSRAWYDLKNKERKDDPLLRYLQQAQNSEEQGIERVVASEGNSRDLPDGRPLKFGERVAQENTNLRQRQ
jgi:hypothetical protein